MARFKELCLDTADSASRIAEFWAAVGGSTRAESHPGEGPDRGPADVVGDVEYQGIAICPVPEPKTVKNRVHLDTYVRSVDDLVALGATVVLPAAESGFGWTTMLDPEGNEFCAFVRDELPAWRVHGIGTDCVDGEATARWWAGALGLTLVDQTRYGDGWWTLEGLTADPGGLTWDFAPVPEPKTVKNRLHWDVYGTTEEFLDLGATKLWDVPGRTRPIAWTVLADPEGNEFCVFPESDAEADVAP